MKAVKIILVSIGVLLVIPFAGVLYLATYLGEHKDLLQGGLARHWVGKFGSKAA